jgi:hypothetical protein
VPKDRVEQRCPRNDDEDDVVRGSEPRAWSVVGVYGSSRGRSALLEIIFGDVRQTLRHGNSLRRADSVAVAGSAQAVHGYPRPSNYGRDEFLSYDSRILMRP